MQKLKLMALDSDDLQVISACCQDAVLKVGEVQYLPTEKRLVMSMNRFAWETAPEAGRNHDHAALNSHERRKSVLQFARVNKVQASGIDPSDKDMVISILAITFEENDSPSGIVELVLAGDGAVRMEVECIEVQLADTSAAWETEAIPNHTA